MKKSLLLVINLLTLLLFISTASYAIKHTVNVGNYYFNPANLNVQVGDTIRWIWVQGSHTTTSTNIPVGAPAWDEPMNISNPVYEYRVSVAGVYNYLCTPHSSTQIGSFTATAIVPTLSVTPANQVVPATAGSTTFSVTSNSNWTATSNASWCSVTSSGSGNGTLTANFQANSSTDQRIATITVSVSGLPNSTVTVTQAGASATLTVTPSNQNVPATAGSTTFNVSSNSNWTAISSDDWCVVTPSGTGNGVITANYQANALTSQRIASITITVNGLPSSIVTVTQSGQGATLTVTPLNQDVNAGAGGTSFNIITNSSWNASSNADWCTVTSSGSGNGTLNASYDENTSIETRIASITITVQGIPSQVVTVTQAGAETILIIDPLNRNVTAQAGITSFSITCNANWQVISDADWASATSDGTGNGSILVNYEENTSNSSRVAVLTVAAPDIVQLVTVTQEGSVAVEDNHLQGLKSYPNPSNGMIEITLDMLSGNSVISVIDMKGNVIHFEKIDNMSSVKLDLSSATEGTYLVKIDNDSKTYVSRIVILK